MKLKYFLGILLTLAVIAIATLGISTLWGYPVLTLFGYPITWALIGRACITALIFCAALMLVYLFYHLFFKPHDYKNRIGARRRK
jgi:uncharacterized membrane-anchored protein